MPDYLPRKEMDLLAWLNNFQTVATTNMTTLGITSAEMTVIQDDNTIFGGDMTGLATAKAAYEGAVQAKNTSRRQTERDVRAIVKRIQNNPNVSDALKAQLGITVPSGGRTNPPPVTPASLAAKPTVDGVNIVAWHRMGNKPGTQYVVYAKPLTDGARAFDDTGWTFVGQTTRARFDHTGVIVGQPMAYRVLAARAAQASLPSLPVTVYGG